MLSWCHRPLSCNENTGSVLIRNRYTWIRPFWRRYFASCHATKRLLAFYVAVQAVARCAAAQRWHRGVCSCISTKSHVDRHPAVVRCILPNGRINLHFFQPLTIPSVQPLPYQTHAPQRPADQESHRLDAVVPSSSRTAFL